MRHPKSSLNQTEWYMSKRSRDMKMRSNSGCRRLANSMAPSCWGISVPKIEARARMIKRTIVSLIELKNRQMTFDLSDDFDLVISWTG